MLFSGKIRYLFLLLFVLLIAGCGPEVKITHSPVVAKSSETVTFTATLDRDGEEPASIQILVNAALVQTCSNLYTGDTCVYTGGPYSAYEGTTVSYAATATDSDGADDTKGYYYFAVTDANYSWSLPYMPARQAGTTAGKEDLIFHRASDYASAGDFIDDVEDKMYDIYGQQDIVESAGNFDSFNFYVYSKVAADFNNCGEPHADADTDMPWRDDDAILHTANIQDCTNAGLSHFSAEGSNTKAFLHESGHAVFGLADEYDGPTGYFEPADEPNIWDDEADCRAEQTAKGRDPDECWQFTTRSGGWWGIQGLADNTVMQVGNVGDPWGTEAEEHLTWYFGQF